MNKRLMAIWGMIIFILCATLLIIGINNMDKKLIKLEREIKISSKKYLKDNNINIKYNKSHVITISDLLDNEYLEKNDDIEKYCIKTIIVTKGLFLYEYKINKDCSNEDN